MTPIDHDEHIEKQRIDWNEAAHAWEKWDTWLDSNMTNLNGLLLDNARVVAGCNVLDIGSGTGFPAIAGALRVGELGSVIGVDISEEMLAAARRKADIAGVTNIDFEHCHAGSMTFEDESFDCATSRFCLMFLPDVDQVLSQVNRVLKKGGAFSALVWGPPEKNPAITMPVAVLSEMIEVPKPDPSLPGIFALAKPGLLADHFSNARFSEVTEKEVETEWRYEDGEHFVTSFLDLAAPFKPLFAKLNHEERKRAESKLVTAAEKYRVGNELVIPGMALLITGVKEIMA